MKFGLTPDQYKYILQTVVGPLEMKGAKVFCFGSRSKGTHKEFSDLDLMIENDQMISSLELSSISEALSNSNFALKVDLVRKSEFAESYLQNYLNERIAFTET